MSLAESLLRPAAGIFVFCVGAYYVSQLAEENGLKQVAKRLLPTDDPFIKIDSLANGTFNHIAVVQTSKTCYLLRCPKLRNSHPSYFERIRLVTNLASKEGFGPRLHNASPADQALLLEYIPSISWPPYAENPKPYIETMKTLRSFHETMKKYLEPEERKDYLPFSFILDNAQQQKHTHALPRQFATATRRIQWIFKQIEPWLIKHGTICHGDLHKGNVLPSKDQNSFEIKFIDFDTAMVGHPYFDVAKFTSTFEKDIQQTLFCTYLGREPTTEEQQHYRWMLLIVLMTMATSWFTKALEAKCDPSEKMTKEQMEVLLDAGGPIPQAASPHVKPYDRQLLALGSLKNFLENTTEPL